MSKPRFTRAVRRGLRILAVHADAGGPDDQEIDMTTREGRRAWADVQRAIRWAMNPDSNPTGEGEPS